MTIQSRCRRGDNPSAASPPKTPALRRRRAPQAIELLRRGATGGGHTCTSRGRGVRDIGRALMGNLHWPYVARRLGSRFLRHHRTLRDAHVPGRSPLGQCAGRAFGPSADGTESGTDGTPPIPGPLPAGERPGRRQSEPGTSRRAPRPRLAPPRDHLPTSHHDPAGQDQAHRYSTDHRDCTTAPSAVTEARWGSAPFSKGPPPARD